MNIELRSTARSPLLTRVFAQNVLRAVQKAVTLPPAWQTISIVVVGDAEMRKLNKRYRNQAYVPDVLSFPYGKDGGEIVVCYPQAKRQAEQKQVPLRTELAWLLIHGCLHIAGYDHEKAADAAIMRPLEQTILQYV